jgi:hypothetical protein
VRVCVYVRVCVQTQLLNASKNVKGGSGALLAAAKAASLGGDDYKNLLESAKHVSDAIAALAKAAEAAEPRSTGDAQVRRYVYVFMYVCVMRVRVVAISCESHGGSSSVAGRGDGQATRDYGAHQTARASAGRVCVCV